MREELGTTLAIAYLGSDEAGTREGETRCFFFQASNDRGKKTKEQTTDEQSPPKIKKNYDTLAHARACMVEETRRER